MITMPQDKQERIAYMRTLIGAEVVHDDGRRGQLVTVSPTLLRGLVRFHDTAKTLSIAWENLTLVPEDWTFV